MPTTCYLLEPAGVVRWGLRRYSESHRPSSCPAEPGEWGYHNATAMVGEEPEQKDARGYVCNATVGVPLHDDPRWPQRCACGYAFTGADQWQKWTESVYRRQDTGELVTLRAAPPGAMWNAWWMGRKGPDGLSLCVKLPTGHEWWIDGPANNGPGWERSGTPPLVTAKPSIAAPGYHGWLTDGLLSDPI